MDDGTPHFARHKVFYVLGDGSKSKKVFTCTLGKTKEEVGGVVIFHKLPSLIDEEETFSLIGAHNVPDMRKHDVHCNWSKLVFKVADIKDDHLVIDVDVRLLRENTCESAGGVFAETLC